MKALIGLLLASVSLPGWQMTEAELNRVVDKALGEVYHESYDFASGTLTMLGGELRRRLGIALAPHGEMVASARMNRAQVLDSIEALRGELNAQKFAEAMQRANSTAFAASNLQRTKTPNARGLGTGSFALASLAREAYGTKDYARARELCNQVIEARRQREPFSLHDQAANMAYTILGLIALQEGELEAAKEQLLLAVRDMSDMSFTGAIPNLMLAEALLKRGEKQVVVEYLRLCNQTVFGNQRARQRMAEYQAKLEAGSLETFGGDGANLH